MKHEITHESWEDYLDGNLPPEERDRIEAHLIGCATCWEFQQRMAALNTTLHEAGTILERSYALSDDKLQAGLHTVCALICASRESGTPLSPVQQRLDELRAVMTFFCGAQTAVNALHSAAAHSPARSLKQVTRENWEPFLQRLTAIAQVLCGRTGARWLAESGRF